MGSGYPLGSALKSVQEVGPLLGREGEVAELAVLRVADQDVVPFRDLHAVALPTAVRGDVPRERCGSFKGLHVTIHLSAVLLVDALDRVLDQTLRLRLGRGVLPHAVENPAM